MEGSKFCAQQHKTLDPTCLVSIVHTRGGGVMVWEGLINTKKNHCLDLLLLTICMPSWPQFSHFLMCTFKIRIVKFT